MFSESFLNKCRALFGYQKGQEGADDGVAYYFTDLKGKRHGRYTEYHNNGNLMAVARFRHGLVENFVELDPQTGRLLGMVEFDITHPSNEVKIETTFDAQGRATMAFNTELFPELADEQKIWMRRAPKDRTAMLTVQANQLIFENTISQPRKHRKAAKQQHKEHQG